jgi:hypothetical protein
MSNKKYRVYAKILGCILPKDKMAVFDCTIQKMNRSEQKRRNFSPLNMNKFPIKPVGCIMLKGMSEPPELMLTL